MDENAIILKIKDHFPPKYRVYSVQMIIFGLSGKTC